MKFQDAFQTYLQDFDRHLQRREQLDQLSLSEAQAILARIETFHLEANFYRETAALDEPDPRCDKLIAASCRLAADLSERVTMRVVDILDSRQHSLDFLYAELRKKLREKHTANTLLQKAHEVRDLTHRTGETCGLGMVL